MLGAPLGGTTRGGHQVFDPSKVSLMTPPNFGSGAGSWFPGIVVVAPGDPGTPVVCCACTGPRVKHVRARMDVIDGPIFIMAPPFEREVVDDLQMHGEIPIT
jgi:hypothetical protein